MSIKNLKTNIFLVTLMLLLGSKIFASTKNETKSFFVLSSFQQKQDSTLYKLYHKADSLYKTKNYTTSLKFALKVIDESDENTDLELVSNANYLVGRIWYASRAYKKAIVYFQNSVQGYSKMIRIKGPLEGFQDKDRINNDYNVLNGNLQVGTSYQRLYELFLDDKEKDSIKTRYRDSTLYYYDKIIQSNSLAKNISVMKSKVYNNLSGMHLRDSAFEKAEEYMLRSLDIKKKIGDQYLLASGYNALSNIHFFKEEYEESKEALALGLKAIEKIKGEKADEIRAGLLLNMAYSMYKLQDYKAYEYQERSWNLYDEIKDRENQQKIADIYADRNFDRGLQEGIYQQEIRRQEAQKVTLIVGISSFFVIVLLVFLLNQYKLRQKNLGLELSKQELMQQQKMEKIKAESQIRILNATLDGKESERKQIAETLHDSVSALLSSANLHLQACKKQFNGTTPIEVDKSQSIINEASQKIRDLSHTLVSSILLKFGLSYAIKDISEKFSNSQLKIDYETRYIKRYDQGFEIKLYNIIQEFVNNILKHSKASYAKITLVEKKNRLHLIIEDDGQGFDKTQIPKKDGLGINQIDARIQMMQGKFNIDTGKGKGTVITIELPVFEKEVVTFS